MTERMRVALLLAVAVLVYGNALWNGFTFDDDTYILSNPTVTKLSLRGLFDPGQDPHHRFFRPLTFATYELNWALTSARPFAFHLFNVLLHAAVTLLLYLVVKKLLEGVQRGPAMAWVTALIFAVHPIHTEAVASIVGRSEVLAAGLLLAAWLFHLFDRPILTLPCFALAMMSKESAVAFVPLAVAGDYVRGKLRPLSRYLWIAGVAALYLGVLWEVQGGRFGEKEVLFINNPLAKLPPGLRILNALRVAWKYVGLQIYPAKLSCDYSYNAIQLYASWRHTAPAAIGALFVVILWIWSLRTKRREWFLAGAIYLAGFAVTSNLLVPTGTIMGERLSYFPSAGLCLLAAALWMRMETNHPKLAPVLLVIVLAALATRTVVRNRDWRNNFDLFSAGVRAVPGSAKLHDGLAGEYIYRGQRDKALPEMQAAIRIYPHVPEAAEIDFRMVYMAAELMKLGENDDALKFLDLEIARSPGFSLAWSNRAVIGYQRGEMAWAREDAQHALHLDPANVQAQYLLDALGVSTQSAP